MASRDSSSTPESSTDYARLYPTSSPDYPTDPRGGFTDYPVGFAIRTESPDFLMGPGLGDGSCYYPNGQLYADQPEPYYVDPE